jgi:hypothetical protein
MKKKLDTVAFAYLKQEAHSPDQHEQKLKLLSSQSTDPLRLELWLKQ